MSLTSAELSTCLAELEADLRPEQIGEKYPELCAREVVLQIADEVNRLAREDLSRAEHLASVTGWLADAVDDDFCRARAARCMANTKVLRGKYSDALQDLSRALQLFRNLGAEIEQAATLSSSLQPLIYQGNYAEALERADEAREIASRHDDDLLLGRLEINFGNILHRQDRFREAIEHYQIGLDKLTKLKQPRDCAIALVNLAVCHISLHDFRRAEQCYRGAREISERENMLTIVAQADYNIAYLYYYRSEYRKAIELYQKTRRYCESVNDGYHRALCDLDQAEMYLELHLHEEGIQLAEHALAAFEHMGMAYEATKAIVLLGIGRYQNQKPFEALKLFAKAQDRMRAEANSSWIATLDLYQGSILQQEGRYFEALRHCRRAQQSLSPHPTFLLADTHILMTTIYLDLGQMTEAENWAVTATETARALESPAHLTRAWWLAGRLAESSGALSEALTAYGQALQHQEAIPLQLPAGGSKIPYSKNRAEIYEAIGSLEISETKPLNQLQILQISEKSKAREIAELLSFRTNPLPTPSRNKSALVEQVNQLREQLNWYYRKANTVDVLAPAAAGGAEDLRSIIREQESSLIKTLGELQRTENEFHSLISASSAPVELIREQLVENEMIVEFSIIRGLICACLLERGDLQIVPLARLATIRRHLRQIRIEFGDAASVDERAMHFAESHLARTLDTLETLHAALIGPMQDRLAGKRLIIVPEGPLHYLPFHALFDGHRFLSEKHILSYAGSAGIHYLSCRKSPGPAGEDFLVSNASASDLTSPPLSSSMTDSIKFTRLANVKELELQHKECRFIHLECSLRLRVDNVLFSCVSVGNTEMSLLDTFHLRLPCDVLGLTGSGTGIRANDDGRELLSLARGLEYAGARTVLMPLWNARREPTQMFLDLFYKGASLNTDRAAVFQNTLGEVRERYPHPFDWAPFTLRGRVRTSIENLATSGFSSDRETRTESAKDGGSGAQS